MKKILSIFLSITISICLNSVFTVTCFAKQIHNTPIIDKNLSDSSDNVDLHFAIRSGYRVDQLDWNIAGNVEGNPVDVISELIWEDLEIYQVQFNNQTIIEDKFYFRGYLKKGWIQGGTNQDTDYLSNNRNNPWSQTINDSNDGSVFDLSLGIGYIFKPIHRKLSIAPAVGFSHHNQYLTMTNGYQTIAMVEELKGPFPGLDSSYRTNWIGPWIGMDITYNLTKLSRVIVSVEYHWADYYAKADWNLRSDFNHPKSFEHDAVANGIVLNVNWNSEFYKNWYYDIDLGYQSWKTDAGIDRTFFSDGTIVETQLNEVNWESVAFMIGAEYKF